MSEDQFGITRLAHVQRLLSEVEVAVAHVAERVRDGKRIRPAERDVLSRRLAGVIGTCETVRIWLGAGAPQ